jgi:flagellar biosynthetic protein FliP
MHGATSILAQIDLSGAGGAAGGGGKNAGGDGGNAVQLLILIAGITLIPALLFCVTGFTRILIVLGFIRSGLGTPTSPPNQVLVGIALFLTLFVMAPTFNAIKKDAIEPMQKGNITQAQAIKRGEEPLREFMFKQTRTKDLALFVGLAKMDRPKTRADIPTHVLIPAFIISELKTAFQIGFLIFLPFLVIDLVVSSTLMSMGMMMLPPVFISLPFKILLFVLVDGWDLVTRSLVESFH